ncbi:MAG: restriction endonuclease subunit S [Armatimonadetes bacterium]|nr:restriction endonuclease subunit S [Armatimonadota bacterium]
MSGRAATTDIRPGNGALSVGIPSKTAPVGWRWVFLNSVATMMSGHTPSRRHPEYWGGDIPWMNVSDARAHDGRVIYETSETTNPLGISNSAAVVLPPWTVCLSRTGSIGYAVILGSEMATSQGFVNWICSPLLRPRFLQCIFQSEKRFLHSISEGVAHTTIYFPEAKAFCVCIPDVETQDEIVSFLDAQISRLDIAVSALKRAQANLKRYRASVLKAACEGRLVPTEYELATRCLQNSRSEDAGGSGPQPSLPMDSFETGEQLLQRILEERRKAWAGRGKYFEPVTPAFAGVDLPTGWACVSIAQVITAPPCNGISQKGKDYPPGIRALRLSAFLENGFDYSDVRYLSFDSGLPKDVWIKEGDFFVSRGNGSLHLVGRGTTAQAPLEPTIYPDTMIRLRFSSDLSVSNWIATIWPSKFIRRQIEDRVKTTAGIYKIAQPQLTSIVVPLPPLKEQCRIVTELERRMSLVKQMESLIATNLTRANHLRQAILQKAFGGAS